MKNKTGLPLTIAILPACLLLSLAQCYAQALTSPQPYTNSSTGNNSSIVTDADNIHYTNALLKNAKPNQEYLVSDDMFVPVAGLKAYRDHLVNKTKKPSEGATNATTAFGSFYSSQPWTNGVIYYEPILKQVSDVYDYCC